jgi:hypothetical protein
LILVKVVSPNIFGIVLLVICIIVIGWSLLITGLGGDNIITIDPQKATAFAISPPPSLQDPIYTENDRTTCNKPMIIDGGIHAIQITFSGYGKAEGINYIDSGKGFVIPRDNTGLINSQGHATIISTNGGKASLTFEEIEHSSGVNGTITASGSGFLMQIQQETFHLLVMLLLCIRTQYTKMGLIRSQPGNGNNSNHNSL